MLKGLDKALGIHQHALTVYAKRAKIISSNLVNADTPNFKARDIDFRKILQSVHEAEKSNNSGSPINVNAAAGNELLYRIPTQPSLDGNTVDVQVETSAFAENAIRYQAVMQFLTDRFKGIKKALRGD